MPQIHQETIAENGGCYPTPQLGMTKWDQIVMATDEQNLGGGRVPPLYPHRPPPHPNQLDDEMGLEKVLQDIKNGLAHDSRLHLLSFEEQNHMSPSRSTLGSSSSSSEDDLQQVEMRRRSASHSGVRVLHRIRRKISSEEPRLPKSESMPFHAVPEPFPEVSCRLSPSVSQVLSEGSCHSSPNSPLVRRAHGSRKGSKGSSAVSTPSSEEPEWNPQSYTKLMLTFYTNETTYKTVMVERSMKVSDVCHLLALKNAAVDDKSWAIVETIHDKHAILERTLEDHENVASVQESWGEKDLNNNRFYFKKDFTKYAIFQNPAKLFPMYMLDAKGDLPEAESDRQRNIILMNLFSSPDLLPDIQGSMHIREGKRSWKKHFFVLRQSGLYYSAKGSSKEGRHLVLVTPLSDVNIYNVTNAKKALHAPSNHCICLKAVNPGKEPLYLCVDDEQTKNPWRAGLRLVKYGVHLRENYKQAVKRDNKLKCIDNRSAELLSERSQVAMDFTGQRGKVIEDPQEALEVALAEAQYWRRKRQMRPARAEVAGSPRDSPPKGGLASGIHMTQPWFYSGISREEAVDLITSQGLVDGVFLVRESRHIPGTYVLSLAHNGKVVHCQITKMEEDGQVFVTPDRGHTKFQDLIQLVEFYQLNAGRLPCRLTNYATTIS